MPESGRLSYPYDRAAECAWEPEQVARHLTALLSGGGMSFAEDEAVMVSPTDGGSSNDATPSSTTTTPPFLLTQGWSNHQVPALRAMYGKNSMPNDPDNDDDDDDDDDASAQQRRPWWKRANMSWLGPVGSALVSQLKEPLILMLLGSAAISILLGNAADALSIALALLIVATVAAVQEYRSEAALEALANLVPHTCTVVRDGLVQSQLLASQLVVGDLIVLGTGDRVPADCRLVHSVELTVDESNLTGENHPVTKRATGIPATTPREPGDGNNPTLSKTSSSLALTEQSNIVFCGTLVTAGRGRALVLAVGEATEFGKVATELAEVTSRKSPLQQKMDELGQRLAYLSSLAIAVLAVVGWLLGRAFLETLTVAVSLAVAAIPEGLPICVTVTLALGVLRMARRKAIVKKLPVVESLGCATTVASDKTGTLTQNEMTVRKAFCLAFPHRPFGFTGVGYRPETGYVVSLAEDSHHHGASSVTATNAAATHSPLRSDSEEIGALSALLHTACLCNNATLAATTTESSTTNTTGPVTSSGQPTELALLCAAQKARLGDARSQYQRLQEIPFSSDRKCMEVQARPTTTGTHICPAFEYAARMSSRTSAPSSGSANKSAAPRGGGGWTGRLWEQTPTKAPPTPPAATGDGSLYFVKGMPEKVLSDCQTYTLSDGSVQTLSEEDRKRVLLQTRQFAAQGLRVLALAYGAMLNEKNLVFCGLLGMEDPPREGVAEAVRQLKEGGVKVMMVTGDSCETALAIAQQCGILDSRPTIDTTTTVTGMEDVELGSNSQSMSGEELDDLSKNRHTELTSRIANVRVFYRVVPRHKLAIVRALQSMGEIVAMTGDGVNDATALKGSDIGIAMGKKGTDVAKEAADVVLADDDFSTITMAIKEGKGIFFNIRCFLAFQLSTSFAALTMASVATAFGMPNPLNAMQILWINIIMDGPPAQSLGVEPVDERILRAKPRKADDPVVTRALLLRAVTSAAIIVFLTLYVFSAELEDGKVTRRDTTVTFMTFVNCDLFNAYVCRSADRCFYELNPLGNPAFLWAVGGSVLGQLLVIYWPPLQEVFQTEALPFEDLVRIIFLSSMILWLDTLRKKVCPSFFSDGYNSPSPGLQSFSIRRLWLSIKSLASGRTGATGNRASRWKSKAKTTLAL